MKGRCTQRALHGGCHLFTIAHWCPVSCGICQHCTSDQIAADKRDFAITLDEWRNADGGMCKRNVTGGGWPDRRSFTAAASNAISSRFGVAAKSIAGATTTECSRRCDIGLPVPFVAVPLRPFLRRADEPRRQPTTAGPRAIPAAARGTHWLGTRSILGGGLNNMLMHTAELLDLACAPSPSARAAPCVHSACGLLLPRLDADPLREKGQAVSVTPSQYPSRRHQPCNCLAKPFADHQSCSSRGRF